jgi:hypothetical protein
MDGNTYAQVFATKDLFVVVYPMGSKSLAGEGLRQCIHEYGRPEHLTFDGMKEQNGKIMEFMKNIRKNYINHKVSDPERPNHNFAKRVSCKIRKKWFRIMTKKKVPKELWDYGFCWVCKKRNELYRLTFYGNICKISLGSQPQRFLSNDGGCKGLGI